MTIQNKLSLNQPEEQVGCLPVLARLFWMAGGNAILFLCLIDIALGKATFVIYFIYVLVTIILVLVRFIDIKYLKGETVNGARASLSHWRRYTLGLLISAGILLIAAKILA